MARDWVEIAEKIEAAFPQARGGTNYDESLRLMLVPWANGLIYELGQMQRWAYDYITFTLTTVQGQAKYSFSSLTPSGVDITAIKRLFYIDSAGYPREIERRERFEATRLLGDTSLTRANAVPQGAPREFSINDGQEIEIFPPPDAAGFDAGGNYAIQVQAYHTLPRIVETQATTIASNATITVPSTTYLTTIAGVTLNTLGSIRSAGYLKLSTINDHLLIGITQFTDATHMLISPSPQASLTNAQTFFNSQPWIITYFPKLVEFGVCREVTTYLKDQQSYQLYEQRYQNELNLLRAYEFDRMRGVDMGAAVTAGQATAVDRRIDLPVAFDVRGII